MPPFLYLDMSDICNGATSDQEFYQPDREGKATYMMGGHLEEYNIWINFTLNSKL